MAAEESRVNLWIRANLECFSAETEALLPDSLRPEYQTLMKERLHWKGILANVLEMVYLNDEACRDLYERAQFPSAEIINLDDHR